MREYYLGHAFTWNLPHSLLITLGNNPYLGYDDVMKGILKCQPDIFLLDKYDALYAKNGYANPKAITATNNELAKRRQKENIK
jgi:hypothetical protein